MTPAARLQASLELLSLIENAARPADALASAFFRSRRYIGSKDRAAVANMTYDVLRHHARLKWWLEQNAAAVSPRSRLLAYLALAGKMKTANLAELFSGQKFAPAVLVKEELAFLKKLEGHTAEHPSMPDAVKGECPDWAAPSLQKRFGKAFLQEMKALMEPAPLDLRINPLKTTREEALAILKKSGIDAQACTLSPHGIRINGRPDLNAVSLLRDGKAEIQDEGSQLVALLADAKPGQRIADFCAGAGGKSLALAAQMQNKGRIVACDVMEGRLKRSAERFRRADVHNIEIRILNNENDPWVKRHKETFDCVLVDAPCSGTGTWRRNPDQRWRSCSSLRATGESEAIQNSECSDRVDPVSGLLRACGPRHDALDASNSALDELVALQSRILASAARLVKPAGRLIYATCSLLPEENERQIEAFLTAHPDFEAVPAKDVLKELPKSAFSGPYLALTPATHRTDGFFAAIMVRKQKVQNQNSRLVPA